MRGRPELTPEERQAYALGRACFEQGDDAQALRWLQRLMETRSDFADVHYMLGLLAERSGDLEATTERLEEALRINPGYVEARLALVTVLERQGQFERARDVAARGVPTPEAAGGGLDATTRGKLANLHAVLGDAYREAGRLREAVESYRKALDLCPAFHDIRQRLGLALREAGLPAQALREFERILAASPDAHGAGVQLGLTCYTLGRTEDALREWNRILARDPAREDARRYLRMVQPAGASRTL